MLGNPGLEVLDIPKVAEVAHANDLPLLIDATFVTPYLCQPIELGADLVVHSATKFLSGHGVVVGGVVVDGGTFDWQSSNKFPTLSEPYVGFHNLVFADEFGPAALLPERARGHSRLWRLHGAHDGIQILQGLETLPLRMAKHVSNALEVAAFLEKRDMVLSVSHPGLPSHPDYELAQRMLPKGCGAVFSLS